MLFNSFNSMAHYGQKAYLETPFYYKGNKTSCLNFYLFQYTTKEKENEDYSIYNSAVPTVDSMGNLTIIQHFNGYNEKILWEYSGTQQPDWILKKIRIEKTEKPYKIIFQAELKFQMKSDIAIDDVSMLDDECLTADNYFLVSNRKIIIF